MVNKATGEPMVTGEWRPVTPQVQGDYEAYPSPVTGEMIEGKRARRYDLEKHGCIDARDMPRKEGFKNPHFMKKRGIQQ
jgi:hypothetical protein